MRWVAWLRGLAVSMLFVVLAIVPTACDPVGPELTPEPYRPRSAHQAYGHALAQTRLVQAALGHDWLAAAERALFAAERISTPFSAQGTFTADRAQALGYGFSAEAGQRVLIDISVDALEPLETFVDIFRVSETGFVHVASAAASPQQGVTIHTEQLELEVLEPSQYVLRVQPELLRAGEYNVSIRTVPLLAFPVQGLDSRAIQSGFGAERDGGVRAHRGVDIFANRGTPALAAMDSWVMRVNTTPRGGNVVWLQPLFTDMRLYYAHLDTQLVQRGQFVQAGEVIGKVGNTGNAITTPPHLHFGVYLRRRGMRGGARDPYHFLN